MADTNTFGMFIKNAPPHTRRTIFALLGVGLVFVLTALSMVIWIWKTHQGPSITEKVLETSRKMATHEPLSFQHSYEIKDMSMAIMNMKGTRTAYSQFTLIFDCADEECKRQMELHRAKVINAVFEVGGDFYVDDFVAPLAATGFHRFKSQIQAKTTEFFGKNAPKLVVLKNWVMN